MSLIDVEIGAIINELCQEAKETFTKFWQKAEKDQGKQNSYRIRRFCNYITRFLCYTCLYLKNVTLLLKGGKQHE